MNRVPSLFTTLIVSCLLTSFVWQSGCKPPPARVRGNFGNDTNSTGSNTTGSNTTSSNTTGLASSGSDAGVYVSDDDPYAEQSLSPDELGDGTNITGNANNDTEENSGEAQATKFEADPKDWTYWRGPHYTGTSYETGLIDNWDPSGGEGSNVLWFNDTVGTRSTPIVMNGKLYTLARSMPGTASEGERVVCLDAATGELLWENKFNVWLSDVPDTRVGWSSVVGDPETGRVYALGVCGYFQCLDGETGKTIWSRPMHEEFGTLSTYGGRTNFPIVFEDQVIVSGIVIGWGDGAKPSHQFYGFDKATGEVKWVNGTRPLPYDTTYSAPVLATIGGLKSLVVGSGDGAVWSLQPRTGAANWQFQFSRRGLNVSPLVVGDRVFTGHSEEAADPNISQMGSMVALKIDGKKKELVEEDVLWQLGEVMAGKSSPLLIDDRIYVFEDGGNLNIFDATSGEQIELDRKLAKSVKFRNMRGSPLYADGKVYAVSEAGQWAIFKPSKEHGIEIVSESGRDKRIDDAYASPIASHGRIYITTMGGMYCLEDTSAEHGLAEAPAAEQEADVKDDQEVAHVQVVPAEALVRPGEQIKFTAHLYNAHGQFLRTESYPQYSLEGEGRITPSGKFTASDDAHHTAVTVSATVGDSTGTARVRVVPDLPWSFNFDKVELSQKDNADRAVGEPPVTWVGMRYRHVIREIDGNKVMVKVNTIPKGTRSRGWLGHPDLHDYTMVADVYGTEASDQLPEIGITAQGYTLALQGNNQILQLRTWVTQERLSLDPENVDANGNSKCKIPYTWEANKWYTMKLKVTNEENRALLQGKVWVRGEEEPAEWDIQCVDPSPQRTGSPGFYGDANFAEIYIDNIKVTPNSSEAADTAPETSDEEASAEEDDAAEGDAAPAEDDDAEEAVPDPAD